jgi:hypothetical protein
MLRHGPARDARPQREQDVEQVWLRPPDLFPEQRRQDFSDFIHVRRFPAQNLEVQRIRKFSILRAAGEMA